MLGVVNTVVMIPWWIIIRHDIAIHRKHCLRMKAIFTTGERITAAAAAVVVAVVVLVSKGGCVRSLKMI